MVGKVLIKISHSDTIPACDIQTDRQTDRQTCDDSKERAYAQRRAGKKRLSFKCQYSLKLQHFTNSRSQDTCSAPPPPVGWIRSLLVEFNASGLHASVILTFVIFHLAAHHSHPPSHIHCFIPGSKLTFSTNLFHQSASTHLDCLLGLYRTRLTLLNSFSFLVIMDARSAMRPCYVLPMFFLQFFYGRLSWPNG